MGMLRTPYRRGPVDPHHLIAFVRIPEPDRPVGGPGEYRPPTGRERRATNDIIVA